MSADYRVLHFAPEPGIEARLREQPTLAYLTADLKNEQVDRALDITDIALPDASIDIVLCNHVLEHVPDDLRALREIHRILRPGGWAILQVPVLADRTFEDPTITSPEARLAAFGQEDHVRVYGPDFVDRQTAAGLVPEPHLFRDELTSTERRRYGLSYFDGRLDGRRETWTIYRCSKSRPRH